MKDPERGPGIRLGGEWSYDVVAFEQANYLWCTQHKRRLGVAEANPLCLWPSKLIEPILMFRKSVGTSGPMIRTIRLEGEFDTGMGCTVAEAGAVLAKFHALASSQERF